MSHTVQYKISHQLLHNLIVAIGADLDNNVGEHQKWSQFAMDGSSDVVNNLLKEIEEIEGVDIEEVYNYIDYIVGPLQSKK